MRSLSRVDFTTRTSLGRRALQCWVIDARRRAHIAGADADAGRLRSRWQRRAGGKASERRSVRRCDVQCCSSTSERTSASARCSVEVLGSGAVDEVLARTTLAAPAPSTRGSGALAERGSAADGALRCCLYLCVCVIGAPYTPDYKPSRCGHSRAA